MAKILLIDDDPDVRTALRRALALDGHDAVEALDGQDGLDLLHDGEPDLVILDVMMPRIDGIEACRRIRAAGMTTPILMLTARAETNDRVAGLDVGADDYLIKPFALAELRARVRALLRRSTHSPVAAPSDVVLRFEDVELNLDTCLANRGGRSIDLTATELSLLELFLRNPRRVITRDLMYEKVWGYSSQTTSNSHEVYVGYLRKKLEADGEPRVIQTVRGIGYALRSPDQGLT